MPSNEIKNKKKYPWTKTKLCNDDFTHPLSFRYDVHLFHRISKYEYLPERRVTATIVVCVKASIFTKQFSPVFQPVRPVRTVVQSASVSHRFIEYKIFTRNSRRTTLYGLAVLRMCTAKLW